MNPCVVHLETTCCAHGKHMVSTWKPGGIHLETMWCQCGNHIVSTSVYRNHMVSMYHVKTMLFSCWHSMVTILTPHGFQVDTTWFACGQHVVSMWTPCGFQCGPHVVSRWIPHHFQITSVANWSRKLTNLWKPVTSLIIVWFSIRKKFWKALGLLYQLVVSSCHLHVGKWWYTVKWPHCFVFGQISLQNHVTTDLSQSEGSILSSLQVAD